MVFPVHFLKMIILTLLILKSMGRPNYKQPKHPAVSFRIVCESRIFRVTGQIDFHSFSPEKTKGVFCRISVGYLERNLGQVVLYSVSEARGMI